MVRLNAPVRVIASVAAMAVLLSACAQPPMGPTVQVMPGPSKPMGEFQNDDALCRGMAQNAVAGQAEAANQNAAGATALGTLGGAALGAAIGAAAGNAGAGAAIGAGTGLAAGGLYGANGTANAQASIQAQYNNAYAQCMYSRGNAVPGYGPPPASAATYGGPPLVQAVQAQLIRLRYLGGPADGIQGPATTNAIVAFERTNGLQVDGVATPALLARLQQTP
jgi:Putative peptidoglycan binding domain